MPFKNPVALLGLLSIIPLIIVYLIRPKPREVPFSSTAFLTGSEAKRSAVVSRMITDPLFWIQLIVLLLLVSAAAGPYLIATGTPGSHLVIVMDDSASMESSFENAIELASLYFSDFDRISIVLAENVPVVALQEGSGAEARAVFSRIEPRAVSADLSGAMAMAVSLIGSEGGGILVVSDFLSWEGDDPEVTRKLIETNGVQVVFANSRIGGDNVAIVGGWIIESGERLNYSCLIHNFGNERRVPITVTGPGGSDRKTISLYADSDYYLSFDVGPGENIVSLDIDDALSLDNKAYVYLPPQRARKVLYIGDDGPALAALESLPYINVQRTGEYDDFDLVALTSNTTTDGKLNRYIHGGGNVVYIATNTSESPEFLPVRINGMLEGPEILWVRLISFAEGIHFDEIGVYAYPDAVARHNSQTLVEANGVPVLSYWKLGRGKVVYFGLEETDFYLRPEYPIFWYKMVNWLTEVPDISESNRRTGEIIQLGELIDIETPNGMISTDTLLLDQVGLYEFQGQTIAANMYNAIESDLYGGANYPQGAFTSRKAGEKLIENELAPWVIVLALALVLFELGIIWWRREM
jgi:hypothetical protein